MIFVVVESLKYLDPASYDHEKVIVKPFFLTKTLLVVVFDMLVNFWKLSLHTYHFTAPLYEVRLNPVL